MQVERGFQGFWRSAASREIERRGMFVPLKKKKKKKKELATEQAAAPPMLFIGTYLLGCTTYCTAQLSWVSNCLEGAAIARQVLAIACQGLAIAWHGIAWQGWELLGMGLAIKLLSRG